MTYIPILTYLVIVVTAVFSWQGFYRPGIRDRYLFDSQRILDHREYPRMLMSGFLHGDWMHFAFNMLTLYLWGPFIELGVGRIHFLIVYFSSILGGSALALYMHRNHHYLSLGASGGVCGILFASIFLLPPGTRLALIFVPIPMPAWVYAVGFLLYTVFGMKTRAGNIGHDAHLGGAISGLAVVAILKPSIITTHPILFASFTAFTLLLFWYLYTNPMMLPLKHFGIRGPLAKRKAKQANDYESFEVDAKEAETDSEKLDRLLAKVSSQGYDRLSALEKVQLKQLSARMSERDERRQNRRNQR
jgi:membrane associated rhomboid family serine protease